MSHTVNNGREETLDPEDWQAFTEIGRQMLGDMLTYLQTVRERPVWQSLPEESQQALQMPLPTTGQPIHNGTVISQRQQKTVPGRKDS